MLSESNQRQSGSSRGTLFAAGLDRGRRALQDEQPRQAHESQSAPRTGLQCSLHLCAHAVPPFAVEEVSSSLSPSFACACTSTEGDGAGTCGTCGGSIGRSAQIWHAAHLQNAQCFGSAHHSWQPPSLMSPAWCDAQGSPSRAQFTCVAQKGQDVQPQKEQCTSEYRVSQNGAHPCVVVPSALATHESVLRLSISRYGEQRTPTAGRGPHHAQWRSSHVRQLYIVRTTFLSLQCAPAPCKCTWFFYKRRFQLRPRTHRAHRVCRRGGRPP